MARGIIVILLSLCAMRVLMAQSGNPMDPEGFEPNLPRDSRLPPPFVSGQASYDLKLLSSDDWSALDDEVKGTNVVFEYRGYRVQAKEVLGDLETNQFVLRGDVNVLGQDYVVRGDYVFVDFRTRSFKFVQGNVDLKPALLQGRAQTDIYVEAAEASGSESRIDGKTVTVTTCEYPNPHYAIYAGDVSVEPGKKLTFRDFRLKILGTTIVRIPKVVIPLNRRNQGITPDFGHTPEEGYFVKTKIGIPVGENTFYARTDLMTRKGIGLGGELVFEDGKDIGAIRAYTNFIGKDPGFTASGNYRREFSRLDVEAEQSYRRFSFINGIDSTVVQSRFKLAPKIASGKTELTFFRDQNASGAFTSTNSTVQLTDRRSWFRKFATDLQINYTDQVARSLEGKGLLSKRQALEVRAQSSYDLSKFVAKLDYQRIIPISQSFNFIGGIDRTPELTLMTDSARLFGPGRPRWWPNITGLVSAGAYHDRFNSLKVNRYFIDFRATHSANLMRLWGLSYDFGIRQGIYSDGTAQYTPIANIGLRYSSGTKLTGNVLYSYTKPHGYSPIQADRTGTVNYLSIDANAEIAKNLSAAGQVGFDFHQQSQGFEGWVSPGIKLEYVNGPNFKTRLSANYLPQLSTLGNIRYDLAWQSGDRFIGLGLRYDGVRDTWANLNLFVDALKIGRLKISALLLYNAYLNRFDTSHFSFIYDLHCAEAVLQVLESNTSFRPGRELVFFIRIKGLPFDTPFGIGRQGQPLDYGVGGGWR
jgi:LPS-assembly protein